MPPVVTPAVIAELSPTGVLRAGINLSNFLLVTGRGPADEPRGVSPDLARAIADRLGVPVRYVPYSRPGELADAVDAGVWDIGLIGAEPQRAEKIAFTAAYAEIEATWLLPAGSPITTIAEVDRPGVRMTVAARTAYDLWLERNIRQATVIRCETSALALRRFQDEGLEALAGLRPGLLADAETMPGSRILDGRFMSVQQAVGTARCHAEAAAFLHAFVEEAKATGLIGRFIESHKVRGLSVAPAT